MAESYAKAQRNKRDLDRKMNTLHREIKINMALLKSQEDEVTSSLLDVQSKTRNLSDTMSYIKDRLLAEKKEAEKKLHDMAVAQSTARHNNEAKGQHEQKRLRDKINHHRVKLEWIDPERPKVVQSLNVMDMVSGPQGFKGLLTKIRAKKAAKLPHIGNGDDSKESGEKQGPSAPQDICGLIDHFLSLPKIYPSKPKKVKPKVTTVMLEKYAEKAKEREMAMSYGTRRRLKRVDYHCKTLKELFLPA